ncbi:MAG: bifunctional serine/threonine-protein kinase/formylglycine-generating enzyme family protein [Planctomycetota bacterium]
MSDLLPLTPAESLLVENLARAQEGARLDLTELCRLHPEHAAHFRELHGDHERMRELESIARELGGEAPANTVTAALVEPGVRPPRAQEGLREQTAGCGVNAAVPSAGAAATDSFRGETQAILARYSSASFGTRYVIEGELGKGGMGAVYRVIDRKLDRPLAMKVILGQAANSATGQTPPVRPKDLTRFLNEAKITGQLDHPGIVPVHEVGVDEDGRAYFTMKLVRGRTLGEVFAAHAADDPEWSTARVLAVIARVCEAMAFAHDRSVIHRDLKPANVMVGDYGEVYVMDWGLARKLGHEEEHGEFVEAVEEELSAQISLTQAGQLLGTPAYMSPEQASGRLAELGPATDVYAIGAMLYQLIAGHPPHCKAGEHPSAAKLIARIQSGPPAPLTSQDSPPELIAICEKALTRDPSKRFASVRELASDLEAFLAGRAVRAFRTGPWIELTKWVQRNRALSTTLAASAVLIVAVVVGFTIYISRKNSELEGQRTALSNANNALVLKSGEAEDRRREAQLNAERATEQARIAKENQQRADQEAANAIAAKNDVLSLSTIQELNDLKQRSLELWPATPDIVPELDRWIADAKVLKEGSSFDPVRGVPAHPSLEDHAAKLAEVRSRALERTPEEIDRDRRAHPQFEEWRLGKARLLWMQRMLGEERWPAEPTQQELSGLLASWDPSLADVEARELSSSYLDPASHALDEITELALSQRAFEESTGTDRSTRREVLAWALLRAGRVDQACAEAESLLEEEVGAELSDVLLRVSALKSAASRWQGSAVAGRIKDRDALASELGRLDSELAERKTWEFASTTDRWWNDQLTQLVDDLESFCDPESGLYAHGVSSEFGWGVPRRRESALKVLQQSMLGESAASRWAEACRSVADEVESAPYRGLILKPQFGLLPIGRDPSSGFWEFAHLQTGEPARRGPDGKLILQEDTGLVFVLLPGGRFLMGSQALDPDQPNYDPWAEPNEAPVHEIELSPFFVSKYELTWGQWTRFTGRVEYTRRYGQAGFADSIPPSLYPVNTANWEESQVVLAQMGLLLPTEAQWEFAVRAGSSTPWWTGSEVASLCGACNLSDSSAAIKVGTRQQPFESELRDGFLFEAAVGSFRPNKFGLHDVCGNVSEFCRDKLGSYTLPVRPRDGERDARAASGRVLRGGDCRELAVQARSSFRKVMYYGQSNFEAGMRPVRDLSP